MIRQTMCSGILLAAAGLGLPIGVWACPQLAQQVENQTSGGCFTTIQAAINAAGPGDTLVVSPGVYNEQPIINHSTGLKLRSSKGPSVTFVQRPGDGAVIEVSSSLNVTIGGPDAGFTLQDAPNAIHHGGFGIEFDGNINGSAIGNVIQKMHATSSDLIGINSTNSIHTLIMDNDIEQLQADTGSIDGVQFADRNTRVIHNLIRFLSANGNVVHGISDISMPGPFDNEVEIAENVISDLTGVAIGILLESAGREDILIRDNSVTRLKQGWGVFLGPYGLASLRMFENAISQVPTALLIVPASVSEWYINYNNFIATPVAVNQSAVPGFNIDYSNNYWGCPGGPGAFGCGTALGTTKFKPFYTAAIN